ncbi:MAG: UPF0175 family protein [Candidatus Hodarchaeales archaeon]
MLDLFTSLNEEEKIILFILGALKNTPINNKTKLQKILFLISNVFPEYQDLIEFEPHLFGPYSEDIEVITEDLVRLGLIETKGRKYTLTQNGYKIFKQLRPKKELLEVIEDFKEFLNDLTQDELLTFIYVTYPDFIDEAVKWEELKKKRIDVAISLLRKQKISFTKAIEISGLSVKDFQELLLKRRIKWKQDQQQ